LPKSTSTRISFDSTASYKLEIHVKKIASSLIVAAALTLTGGSTFAQSDNGLKIAVLNMAEALLNSDVAKGIELELQAETKEDQDKLRNLATQGQQLQERLQKDGEVMSEAEQRRVVGEIQEIQNQYQFLLQKIQTLSNERRQQFQQTYAPNLVQAISEVVEEEGFDLVIRGEAALYYDNTLDITARVTEKLNLQ
jgi:outer membrane protein